MEDRNWPNLAAMFFDQARAARRPAVPVGKARRRLSPDRLARGRFARRRLARGLRALGIGRGDRVALVSENRPEWVIADLAIMSAGGDHRAGLYHQHASRIIATCSATAARAPPSSRPRRWRSALLPAAADRARQRQRRHRDRAAARRAPAKTPPPCVAATCWRRAPGAGEDVAAWVAELRRDDIACLIYTSGTGGLPKGVMTSHGNILANCRGAFRAAGDDRARRRGVPDRSCRCRIPTSTPRGMMFPISLGAADLFRRRGRDAGDQHARGAADNHDRGAAALRDHASAHPARQSSARAA